MENHRREGIGQGWWEELRRTGAAGEERREREGRHGPPPETYGSGYSGGQPVERYGGSPYGFTMGQGAPQRRGPKGYQRSDDRIREDIYEQIISREHIDASDVTVDVKEGHVTLTGEVPERRMKHEIEDLAADCRGVQDVENRIRVHRGGLVGALFGTSRSVEAEGHSGGHSTRVGSAETGATPDAIAGSIDPAVRREHGDRRAT